MEQKYATLKASFEKHGQAHVFQFWEQLTDTQKQELIADLEEVNVALIDSIFEQSTKTSGIDPSIQPPADEDVKNLYKEFSKQEQVW